VIDRHVPDRALWHLAVSSIARVLNHCVLDCLQAGCPVGQEAREQHPDHPRTCSSRRPNGRADRSPAARRAPGPAADMDLIVTDDQMMAGRGGVNIARREVLALFRRHNRQARGAPEHLGEQAGLMIGRVQHDEKRRRQIGRQVSQQPLKRLDPAHRGANDDDVTLRRLRLSC
jgi:hypothetical protein